MNKRLLAAVIILGALLVGIFTIMPEAKKPVRLNDQVIPFQLPDLQGKLQGVPQGKVVILNFWATWCPPCRKEIPSMIEMYSRLKDKGLEIIAVSEDKNADLLAPFVAEQKMNFTILHDPDSVVAHQYSVFAYPESFIIDRNGVIRQHLKGAVEWMQPDFYGYIEKLLHEQAGQTQ